MDGCSKNIPYAGVLTLTGSELQFKEEDVWFTFAQSSYGLNTKNSEISKCRFSNVTQVRKLDSLRKGCRLRLGSHLCAAMVVGNR